jgi:hypothetical protein
VVGRHSQKDHFVFDPNPMGDHRGYKKIANPFLSAIFIRSSLGSLAPPRAFFFLLGGLPYRQLTSPNNNLSCQNGNLAAHIG